MNTCMHDRADRVVLDHGVGRGTLPRRGGRQHAPHAVSSLPLTPYHFNLLTHSQSLLLTRLELNVYLTLQARHARHPGIHARHPPLRRGQPGLLGVPLPHPVAHGASFPVLLLLTASPLARPSVLLTDSDSPRRLQGCCSSSTSCRPRAPSSTSRST